VEPTQPIRYPVVVPARLRQYQHSALGAATSAASEFKPVKFQVPKTFAGWSTDDSERLASSSGGIFSVLARPIIDAGGAVAGCIWGENWTPKHILAKSWEDVEKMKGSKYAPSQSNLIYEQVIGFLRSTDKPVLFSGTPCQIAAMASFLKPEMRCRVLLVDVICHGVPSLTAFHNYLNGLFGGEKVVAHTYRDKTIHWQTVKAKSESGKEYMMDGWKDPFFVGGYTKHLYLMESCYDCQFVKVQRDADITIGDFWKCPPELYSPKGVSIVFANSDKGLNALRSKAIASQVKLTELPYEKVIPRFGITPGKIAIPEHRRAILEEVAKSVPFKKIRAKYFPEQTRWDYLITDFRASNSKLTFLTNKTVRIGKKLAAKLVGKITLV
jgi:coenzyme F420-reducing hydrogenase beta subunit